MFSYLTEWMWRFWIIVKPNYVSIKMFFFNPDNHFIIKPILHTFVGNLEHIVHVLYFMKKDKGISLFRILLIKLKDHLTYYTFILTCWNALQSNVLFQSWQSLHQKYDWYFLFRIILIKLKDYQTYLTFILTCACFIRVN